MPGLWLQEVWRQVFPSQVLTLLSLMVAAPEAESEGWGMWTLNDCKLELWSYQDMWLDCVLAGGITMIEDWVPWLGESVFIVGWDAGVLLLPV